MPSRPESNRARTNSSIAGRYRPRTYSDAPPTQPDPSLLGPHQQPYPPQQPPYPQQGIYAPGSAPIPMPQAEPRYPNPPLGTSSRHSSYTQTRPPIDEDYGRRPSYSSQHSRRSHESRHSRDSHVSRESRLSRDSKRSRHSKHSADDERYERRPHGAKSKNSEHPKRTNERPTMVDSLFSMFDLFKSALGPRDK